jgi:asparagine synthase (glutamine-hydrolysing)
MCGIWQLFLNEAYYNDDSIKELKALFTKLYNRGPDSSEFVKKDNTIIGFHRLAINGLNENGMQPFFYETDTHFYTLICNGEIYNHKELETIINYENNSKSDCEVILPYFAHFDNNFKKLMNDINGEFAMVVTIKDKLTNNTHIYLGTDPLSVRPMFYQELSQQNGLIVSSLLKGLFLNVESKRLQQGEYRHYYQDNIGNVKFIDSCTYHEYIKPKLYRNNENTELYRLIVNTFEKAVEKRLMSDRPYCCLLSGGLDSSLVASVAQRIIKRKYHDKKLHTFTIGMDGGSDLEYADKVAKFIDSIHTEVNFTPEQGLNAIDNVISACETYDITTVRASVGQHLLAKYISENTDFKVILNGDGADEVEMGYLYYYLAPNVEEAQNDSVRLVKNICMFDGLRVDRNISYFGLEARVPFLDKEFVDMYLNIEARLKIPTNKRMEKYLIRKAFAEIYKNDPILPDDILWRKKEAFSDGVSHKEKSWYVMTQEYGKSKISDIELEFLQLSCKDHIPPTSCEAGYYRKKFMEQFGSNAVKTIPYYWLPNWSTNKDPSARTLNVYRDFELEV